MLPSQQFARLGSKMHAQKKSPHFWSQGDTQAFKHLERLASQQVFDPLKTAVNGLVGILSFSEKGKKMEYFLHVNVVHYSNSMEQRGLGVQRVCISDVLQKRFLKPLHDG